MSKMKLNAGSTRARSRSDGRLPVPLPSGDAMRDDRVGDRFCLDRADDADVELAEEPASALALRTTDLLSSRNINDS